MVTGAGCAPPRRSRRSPASQEEPVPRRSIGLPLTLGITLIVIALVLGVGWQLLVVGDLGPVTAGLSRLHWLLIILGSLFFLLMIAGLLGLCWWLVREIRFNQRQQAFLDAVTHEMKTPLAALRLTLETLARHDPPEERRRQFLKGMEEEVDRLERTVVHVLAAARAEGLARLRPEEPIDLTEVVRRSADDVAQRHDLDPDTIRIDRKQPLTALGDAADLELVFRNLLENAVKYSEAPARVRVELAETPDGRAVVEIEDDGIGIERQDLRKIFQRFYRTGRDLQNAAGLGLGLFIVWSLVRRNGGRVEARSEGAGRGSRFVVKLRAAPGQVAVRELTGSPSAVGSA
jgi:signal transduction histidine kinase